MTPNATPLQPPQTPPAQNLGSRPPTFPEFDAYAWS